MSDNHSNLNDNYYSSSRLKARLALILKTGKLRLWFYQTASRHFFLLSEQGNIEKEYNPTEFAHFFNRDDFELMRGLMFDICDGKRQTAKAELAGLMKADGVRCHYETSISVASRDANGRPVSLLGVQHDVTDEVHQQEHTNRMLIRYHTIFNSSQLDMLFYDKNGVLTDINDRACDSFHVKDRDLVLNGTFLLQNNPMFNQITLDRMENTFASSVVDFSDFTDEKYQINEFKLKGKMYYESAINPIRNENGELEGIYMSGRNITEMVESFHRQEESSSQLIQATKSIEEYINNINYALRVNHVLFVNYDPRAYYLEISDNVSHSQLRLTQLRCIRLAAPRFRRTVNNMLNRMDHLTLSSIEQSIELTLSDKQKRPMWLLFNMVPIIDAEGRVERYFGMCRSITDIVATEQQLALESEKAKESEVVMQSFLTNMSKEIRTPLKTVVSYANRFIGPHNEQDEPFFAEEIKRRTNDLLLLINDVLFLSRLDANMQKYNKTEVNIIEVFDNLCQIGMSVRRPEVNAVITHPYNSLIVYIDEKILGIIIQRLCHLSCMNTWKGAISASYDYRHGELTIMIEDTGNGIKQDMKSHIFERFARDNHGDLMGTGLDLPIVQTLIQQMGGFIDIQSEEGVGTTVWVTLPCEAKYVEKKRVSTQSKQTTA